MYDLSDAECSSYSDDSSVGMNEDEAEHCQCSVRFHSQTEGKKV